MSEWNALKQNVKARQEAETALAAALRKVDDLQKSGFTGPEAMAALRSFAQQSDSDRVARIAAEQEASVWKARGMNAEAVVADKDEMISFLKAELAIQHERNAAATGTTEQLTEARSTIAALRAELAILRERQSLVVSASAPQPVNIPNWRIQIIGRTYDGKPNEMTLTADQ